VCQTDIICGANQGVGRASWGLSKACLFIRSDSSGSFVSYNFHCYRDANDQFPTLVRAARLSMLALVNELVFRSGPQELVGGSLDNSKPDWAHFDCDSRIAEEVWEACQVRTELKFVS
jgi:hypothetical protein